VARSRPFRQSKFAIVYENLGDVTRALAGPRNTRRGLTLDPASLTALAGVFFRDAAFRPAPIAEAITLEPICSVLRIRFGWRVVRAASLTPKIAHRAFPMR
jgi:hypothetical protein